MAKKKSNTPTKKVPAKRTDVQLNNKKFPIAAIGASAGGLKAIELLFEKLPANTGVGFIVIQHASPDQKSILGDIIRKITTMKVFEAENAMEVQPNCVYVVQRNQKTEISNRILTSVESVATRGIRLSIDFLFRSLAKDQKENAICIILSGTGADGTLGMKAIKENGGIAIAQSPSSAAYEDMPQNAINTGLIDYILKPEDIPEKLLFYIEDLSKQKPDKDLLTFIDEKWLQKILTYLHAKTGHNFLSYKHNTIKRRLNRRMTVNQIEKIEDYYQYLTENKNELDSLFRELLIGVTNFFRDKEAFESLKSKVLPLILDKGDANHPIRIWVPGCSTGEEAYSLAIMFYDELQKGHMDTKLQIFATDIDSNSVSLARQGVFPASISMDIPKVILDRHFTKKDDLYRINKNIREMIVFAEQSVIKDPPFSKLDLISCRNLLIYLSSELQQRILPLFNYALNSEGFLFLGSSETLGKSAKLFNIIDRRWKLFKVNKPFAIAASFPEFPTFLNTDTPDFKISEMKGEAPKQNFFKKIVETALLNNFEPAIVLVDDRYHIHYVHGRTGKYLELAEGNQDSGILNMAGKGLRAHLTTALLKAAKDKETVEYKNIHVDTRRDSQRINLSVVPVASSESAQNLMLVVFEDIEDESAKQKRVENTNSDEAPTIKALDKELQTTQNRLQFTVEELEATNEELKSTNEELQSSNEELQSTNEELETSKEELQSLNEELVTVNSEHQIKIEELATVNNDLNNLLSNTDIGTVFLDNELRIKKFTPKVTKIINLIETDIGRPIEDIVNKLDYENIEIEAQNVLDTLNTKEVELKTKNDEWYLMRLLPYRTTENYIEGVVITFVDITKVKQAELERNDFLKSKVDDERVNQELNEYIVGLKEKIKNDLRISKEKFSKVFQLNTLMMVITNLKSGIIIEANDMYTKHTGFNNKELIGKSTTELKLWKTNNQRTEMLALLKKNRKVQNLEVEFRTKKGEIRKGSFSGQIIDLDGKQCLLSTIINITEPKKNDQEP